MASFIFFSNLSIFRGKEKVGGLRGYREVWGEEGEGQKRDGIRGVKGIFKARMPEPKGL